jgi:hypothetical protein
MPRYRKKEENIPVQSTYKRFCRSCGRTTFDWNCCGRRTSRLNMDMKRPEMKKEVEKSTSSNT